VYLQLFELFFIGREVGQEEVQVLYIIDKLPELFIFLRSILALASMIIFF